MLRGIYVNVKITLVNPPYPRVGHQHPPAIPLGIGYMAAVLEKNGYSVNIIDCQALHLSHEDFEKEIAKQEPTVIGVTSTTFTYNNALKVIRIAKRVHPDAVTMLGGVHVTFWDKEAFQECPEIDVIVRKEGEYTLLELADRLKADKPLTDVLGTSHMVNGELVRNEDRPYIQNLDDLPFPAHHLFPLKTFMRQGKIIFPLVTSRGCVYWCNFCSAVRMFGRGYRMRSPKNVVDEMEMLHKKYGATQMTFYDDAFSVDHERVEQICDELLKRKLKIAWDCETRVDMVTNDLLKKMRKAGCIAVWFGVESCSKEVLSGMGKSEQTKEYVEQTKRAFKWVNDNGMMIVTNIILGFPGETKESAWETVNYVIKELNPHEIGFYIATPYPGTPLYDTVKEKGWLRITNFDSYDTATPTFETPMITMKDLQEIREKAYMQFYLRPTYVLRMISKGGVYGISSAKTSFAYLLRFLGFKF
ncbi:MAG: B12-binding domain-containing radical SAM protein [Candidatus Bathyarchaeota archaeon]|nr:B12-binding domain-containing radical SAM protein [Candidatus Bathyarchaeota archaeon]